MIFDRSKLTPTVGGKSGDKKVETKQSICMVVGIVLLFLQAWCFSFMVGFLLLGLAC